MIGEIFTEIFKIPLYAADAIYEEVNKHVRGEFIRKYYGYSGNESEEERINFLASIHGQEVLDVYSEIQQLNKEKNDEM